MKVPVKRLGDILVSGTALIALSPLFLIISLLIQRDGGPAFFKQKRVGMNGKIFYCYKFRSMRVDAEEYLKEYLECNKDAAEEWRSYQKIKNDIRVTSFGKFIRKTSIDELPQLINVLKGDMSLVGPRPFLPEQEHLYGEKIEHYKKVRPGITGLWQIGGRNKLTFEERVNLETYYVENWNLYLDFIIILKTIPAVLKKDEAF